MRLSTQLVSWLAPANMTSLGVAHELAITTAHEKSLAIFSGVSVGLVHVPACPTVPWHRLRRALLSSGASLLSHSRTASWVKVMPAGGTSPSSPAGSACTETP